MRPRIPGSLSTRCYRHRRIRPCAGGLDMPLNHDLIGHTYEGSRTFEVSREHIQLFAEAIGDPNPAYVDPEAARALGYRDVVAPPTFLTTVGMRLGGGPVH